MKNLLALTLLTLTPFAVAETSSLMDAAQAEMEMKSSIENLSGGKEYVWKESISCSKKASGKDATYPNLKAVEYYVCPDKTISHSQPASTGYNGWEGKCGQTAISNVASMLCNRHMGPKSIDFYGTDVTPGHSPMTMRKTLTKIFNEKPKNNACPKVTWKTRSRVTKEGFLKAVKGDLFGSTKKVRRYRSETTYVEVTPTPVLLNSGGLNYHWVTVVDIVKNKKDAFGCDVIVNTWGNQKVLTCENFVHYGDHTGLSEYNNLGFD